MSGNQLTVKPTGQQQVVTAQPRNLQHDAAEKLFGGSSSKSVAAPADSATTVIAEWEKREHAELVARLPADAIADATKLMAAFKTPQLETWVRQNGLGHNVWVHDMLARIWRHIATVERERDALRKEIATLKLGRR
jgi:hypothetical protein